MLVHSRKSFGLNRTRIFGNRITGSRYYSLYTFSKENRDNMAKKNFWFKGFKSKYTDHGNKYEKEALEIYSKNNNVIEMGLVICQKFPRLAYSPDMVVLVNGVPERLVDNKCPYDSIENVSINLIRTCSYLEVTVKQGICLKKNHSYYGQVQLGMAILNLQVCGLILYLSSSKKFLNILVQFATKMLDTKRVNILIIYYILFVQILLNFFFFVYNIIIIILLIEGIKVFDKGLFRILKILILWLTRSICTLALDINTFSFDSDSLNCFFLS
ncbi:unnamed protein product [Psylliodes chrysocephalus]|uniref:YqaJ viral recombinase domain-containing protein n=1 Tax=Psylliodes chrysocephalus TaxID=3402493 RepID=A0A9P0GEA0_9CUCU|nr:unnamed protein product [Psylliodes chrysocephala]